MAQRVAGGCQLRGRQGVRVRVEARRRASRAARRWPRRCCTTSSERHPLQPRRRPRHHEGGLECMEGGLANAAYQTVVRVSDTGPGIPAELHDKVFERFFRVDKSRSKETGGTGLGLAIVKHAVMYHGGVIEVESAEGQGTTFVLRFPSA
ncbi:MAG: sensor histidine kinase [Eggerthella lenta]